MGTYYVYHCSISEIDVEDGKVHSVLEAHTEDSKIHMNKNDALKELRDIIDQHCVPPLSKEIERLNRVVAVLDRKVTDAATIPV